MLFRSTDAAAQARRGTAAPRIDYEVRPTGLVPVFPERLACEPIASGWGSAERFDGSARLQGRNSGKHGGLDISLKEGTPILAAAAGQVIARGEGGQLEGIYLWIQHLQADTGLPYRTISKYQHLSQIPAWNVGDRVAAGQVVARSGMTGTRGPAFGPDGYPHLHWSLFVLPEDKAPQGGALPPVPPREGTLSDPLLLFLPPTTDIDKVFDLPDSAKRIPVGVADASGRIEPAGRRVVWPVACTDRTR